ncbi:hypothetical protein [Actinoplanes couchii]|nr:hypothetical protein [Actinoplanes couchii]MDR6317120.1 hypothetical protein [Actinoplanes couchii]
MSGSLFLPVAAIGVGAVLRSAETNRQRALAAVRAEQRADIG